MDTEVVPKSANALRAEREVVRLCHRGLDPVGIQRDALRALRRLIPVDAAFFATADPDTLLFTGAWPDQPLDTVTWQFLDNEFGVADVNKFAALATSLRPVNSLDAATHGDRAASARYRDILRPIGLGDELRAALISRGRCWGYLCLHREDGGPGFTAAEARTLAGLGPHFAHALRTAVLLHGPNSDVNQTRPGVVLLAPDRSLIAITPEAEHLLSLVDHPGTLELPPAVYAVAAALAAIETATAHPTQQPSLQVPTRTGSWLSLHASRLHGPDNDDGGMTVIVEPIDPRATIPLILSAHGLSRRESDVITLVLRGQPTRTIADELHISAHTVQDHLKAVFTKLDVRSRRDLVSHLLGTRTTPI